MFGSAVVPPVNSVPFSAENVVPLDSEKLPSIATPFSSPPPVLKRSAGVPPVLSTAPPDMVPPDSVNDPDAGGSRVAAPLLR